MTTDQLDAVLPQTQCGLCEYNGCRPYAEAIAVNNEKINLCPPGGTRTLLKLAELTQQNPQPYIEEMIQKTKPPMRAVIREAECIGCTKCIQACPVDAIVGATKQMHTVLINECTGCELCVAPCPVDCIDMITLQEQTFQANIAKQRYEFRNYRLEKDAVEKAKKFQEIKLQQRKAEILASVARVKKKKISTL